MIKIQTSSNGKYRNLNIRDLADGESMRVTLAFDRPQDAEYTTKDGKMLQSKRFTVLFDGEKASMFVPTYLRSTVWEVPLASALTLGRAGTIFDITKHVRTTASGKNAGKSYTLYEPVFIGVDWEAVEAAVDVADAAAAKRKASKPIQTVDLKPVKPLKSVRPVKVEGEGTGPTGHDAVSMITRVMREFDLRITDEAVENVMVNVAVLDEQHIRAYIERQLGEESP